MPTGIAEALTDDQVALLGCVVALLVTGTLMSVSFYIGRARTGGSSRTETGDADVCPLAGATVIAELPEDSPERRAMKRAA